MLCYLCMIIHCFCTLGLELDTHMFIKRKKNHLCTGTYIILTIAKYTLWLDFIGKYKYNNRLKGVSHAISRPVWSYSALRRRCERRPL